MVLANENIKKLAKKKTLNEANNKKHDLNKVKLLQMTWL